MRLRAGLVVCLYAVLIVAGCRDALVPNIDTNQPPETYITAAPTDTLTSKDPSGRVIEPSIGNIPVKFHLYWAGADVDGEVTGFYYAVVETVTQILPGATRPPRLPGPKPRDYHFTTRTDTTFIFNVAEFSPDRQHAFYIYAVDNKGRPDPTPARFVFNAVDRYPPVPIIDEASATGTVFRRNPDGSVFTKDTTYFFTDTLNPMQITRQFAPVISDLVFRWHAELTSPQLVPSVFKYKLDETDFIAVDSSTRRVDYSKGTLGPGNKVFTLKVLDQAGGARSTTRRFGLNLPPDTWWSGPDPNAPFWSSRPKTARSTQMIKYAVPNWSNLPADGIPTTLISPDSVNLMPVARPYRATFLEIYKDTLYVRGEGDTVHLNSWVIFANGGFDADSPYNVIVSSNDPDRPIVPGPVVTPGPPNGSPVGFHALMAMALDPFGTQSTPSQTGLYPLFDPTNYQRVPTINAYQKAIQSGRAVATVRAEDGTGKDNGGQDDDIPAQVIPYQLAVDDHGTAEQRELRKKKILTFYVNYDPILLTSAPTFSPKLPVDTLPTRQVNLNLLADDIDPYDAGAQPKVGGPTVVKVLRFTVGFKGQTCAGRDTTIYPASLYRVPSVNVSSFQIPGVIVSSRVDAIVELCDCLDCENAQGRGRCAKTTFPLIAPVGTCPDANGVQRSRPGFSSAVSRGNEP
jgi:hypothetical protein